MMMMTRMRAIMLVMVAMTEIRERLFETSVGDPPEKAVGGAAYRITEEGSRDSHQSEGNVHPQPCILLLSTSSPRP